MKIERALKMKKGHVVWYPEHQGEQAGLAIVISVSTVVQHCQDIAFVWVQLEGGNTLPSHILV